MRTSHRTMLLATLIFAICATSQSASAQSGSVTQSRSLTPARASAVETGVRAFMSTVAHDVTQDGPSAWRKHFADTPSFFMAVNGQLVFADSAAVTAAIPDLARVIKHIELRWSNVRSGDDLRVDPLTADLAVVATSWHEVITDPAGNRVEATGYFTGTVGFRDGRWQFRNAHWSVAVPTAPVH
jgi:hypothetical protein